MSFKSRLIEYCENVAKLDCYCCPLIEPCDKVTPGSIPSRWSDEKFELMRQYLEDYHTHLVDEMAEVESVLREGE